MKEYKFSYNCKFSKILRAREYWLNWSLKLKQTRTLCPLKVLHLSQLELCTLYVREDNCWLFNHTLTSQQCLSGIAVTHDKIISLLCLSGYCFQFNSAGDLQAKSPGKTGGIQFILDAQTEEYSTGPFSVSEGFAVSLSSLN